MSDIYRILAPYYDEWNAELDYSAWADGLEAAFHRYFAGKVESICDLGCGPGSMTIALAERGYDMIGVDLSSEMLTVARERAEVAGVGDRILWLLQDITAFELFGTVEAVISCLDTMNHLTDRAAFKKCLSLVHNYLVPGGLFLFDLNSRRKFEEVYGDECYVFEADGVYCTWQNSYRPSTKLCTFDITLFEQDERSGLYRRYGERQTERMYPLSSIRRMLAECGFEWVGAYGCADGAPLSEEDERWYIVARAVKDETPCGGSQEGMNENG